MGRFSVVARKATTDQYALDPPQKHRRPSDLNDGGQQPDLRRAKSRGHLTAPDINPRIAARLGELRLPSFRPRAFARATPLLCGAARRELTANQFGVEAAVRDERGMCSGFDEASGIQHSDEVGVAHGR